MMLPPRNMFLLLLVAPLVSALINGVVLYYLAQYLAYIVEHALNNFLTGAATIIVGVAIGDGVIISIYIADKIYDKPQRYFTTNNEKAVNDLQHVTKFFYFVIFVMLGVTAFMIFNMVNVGLPRFLYLSTPLVVSLSGAVITLVVAILAMAENLLRKDFQYYIARMSVQVVDKTVKDEDKTNRFLGIVLNSYDKFIQKKLRLEFDTTKVFSMVLTSKDKDKKMKEIIESFNGDDKFKPLSCLSEGSVKNSEPFLVKKRPWTIVKEVGTFLAVIIPVLIAVVQLIQSYVKFAP